MEPIEKILLDSEYDIALRQKMMSELHTLSEIEQRRLYYMPNVNDKKQQLKSFISTCYELKIACIYEDKITISYQKRIFYFNRVLYTKASKFYGLTYDKQKKKIKLWNCKFNEICFLCEEYLNKTNHDWFINTPQIVKNLLTKTLMEGIMNGKITNPEVYIKKWLKTSLKTTLHYRLVKDFLYNKNKNFGEHQKISLLKLIVRHVDNPNEFIRRINTGDIDKEYLSCFYDTINQCDVFDKKIKWNWSLNRLNSFHLELVEQLHMLEIGELSTTPINFVGNLTFPESTKCELIVTERQAFEEGNAQHNCVYTNYWDAIKNKRYFIIRCFSPIRCTVGISWNIDKPYVQQIYAKYNKIVSNDIRSLFIEWCDRDDVISFFKENFKKNFGTEDNLTFNLDDLNINLEDVERLQMAF